ncbi:MAG: ATP-binding domain-containing protein [Gammaproteobacteria bacterium]|nr:ATP-binding domain-containing protein [Gammaproteobacteria bacterium]
MVMEFEQGEALDRLFKFGHIEKESDLLRIAHPPAGRYRTHTRSRIHPSRHQASQHLRAPGWLPGVAGFRLGPFCHRRRDQDTDEFGIGHIVAIDNELLTCNVTFLPDQREVIYQKEQLVELELAYAITIHKAQGSEFAIVIIPLLTQHFKMLYRNLIYTGLTRARKLVVVVGSRRALAMAVRQQDTRLRQTALQYLLSGDN